jgi:hypothetical protein
MYDELVYCCLVGRLRPLQQSALLSLINPHLSIVARVQRLPDAQGPAFCWSLHDVSAKASG